MQSNKQEYRIGPGASSLLLIFVALCLTTVAILALISAVADGNMTTRSEETVNSYYVAAARAQRELSGLDARLAALREASADPQSYIDGVFKLADGLDSALKPSVGPIEDSEDALISLSVPMYGGHEIFVRVRVPASLSGERYTVVTHMVQDYTVWTPDDSMELYGMQHAEELELEADAHGDAAN